MQKSDHFLLFCLSVKLHHGRTILFTTHYIEEAERLCDRVAIMDHGRILAMNSVAGMIERYGGKAIIEAELESVPACVAMLPGRLDGTNVTIETDKPFDAIKQLTAAGALIRTMSVKRPSLETVFLKLTGRRLRD